MLGWYQWEIIASELRNIQGWLYRAEINSEDLGSCQCWSLLLNVDFYLRFGVVISCRSISKSFDRSSATLQYLPKSIAHMPVPVPTSSTRCNFWSLGIGAVYNLPPKVNENKWCCRSKVWSGQHSFWSPCYDFYLDDHFLPALVSS